MGKTKLSAVFVAQVNQPGATTMAPVFTCR